MNQLTDQEYLGLKTLEKRLRSVFYRFNLPGSFEDFFQYYHERYLLGYSHNQRLDYFAIDYLRSIYGQTGEKQNLIHAYSLNESIDTGSSDNDHDLFEVHDAIDKLKGKTRVVAGLMLIHGLEDPEIAFLFNVTMSRICQLRKQMQKNISKDLPFDEDKDYLSLADISDCQRIESAAKHLGVSPLKLKEFMDKERST